MPAAVLQKSCYSAAPVAAGRAADTPGKNRNAKMWISSQRQESPTDGVGYKACASLTPLTCGTTKRPVYEIS